MNRFSKIFFTFLAISIFSLSQINVTLAQTKSYSAKKSNQIKYNTYQKSSSLKSTAKNVEFRSPKNIKYNSNNDEKIIKKDYDSSH